MHPFTLERPRDLAAALAFARPGRPQRRPAEYIAGGTDMVQLLQEYVRRPDRLVSLAGLLDNRIEVGPQGLRLGAAATMADVAAHPAVVEQFPVISEALLNSASPQVRNQATMGGNLLQRTRCPYFRDVGYAACNKRAPGSGCAAIGGENRWHAVLGTSENCIAANASDLAVALVALDAAVEVRGPGGQRTVPLADFHRLPGATPHIETVLEPGEVIAAITVPASPAARRSHYLKVRDRASFEFAVVSAAVALDMDGARIRQARIALGGVGTKPWRVPRVEAALAGASLDPAALRRAAALAARGRAGARATTTSRSNSCSAPSCVPSKPRELAHDHRLHRTARQPRRRPPEGDGRRHLRRRIRQPGLAHGAIVRSTVANGRIASIDSAAAERAPGVLAVLTHRNAPQLAYRPHKGAVDPDVGERLHVLQDDRVNHQGQPIALVIAETLEQANHAATLVRVTYAPETGDHRHFARRAGPADAAEDRPGRDAAARDAARRSRRSPRGRRGQGRPDLRDPAREPQSDRDARHDRGLGRRPPDPVGQDAVGAQHRRRDRRGVRHSGARTSASSRPLSAAPSARPCAPGRM